MNKLFYLYLFLSSISLFAQNNTEPYIIWVNPDSIISKDYLIGNYDPETTAGFVKVDTFFACKPNFYLQKDAYIAFQRMYYAALRDSIKLTITSATRNCDYQKWIWDSKWYGTSLLNNKNASKIADPFERTKTIIKYVAMPQTSRHHWGTDVDVITADTAFFSTPEGKRIYNWLKTNAATYGFCQPYTLTNQMVFDAYGEEKWHWSYIPLAYLFLKNYKKQIKYEDIYGFFGSEYAKTLNVIQKYATRIETNCF